MKKTLLSLALLTAAPFSGAEAMDTSRIFGFIGGHVGLGTVSGKVRDFDSFTDTSGINKNVNMGIQAFTGRLELGAGMLLQGMWHVSLGGELYFMPEKMENLEYTPTYDPVSRWEVKGKKPSYAVNMTVGYKLGHVVPFALLSWAWKPLNVHVQGRDATVLVDFIKSKSYTFSGFRPGLGLKWDMNKSMYVTMTAFSELMRQKTIKYTYTGAEASTFKYQPRSTSVTIGFTYKLGTAM